MRSIMTILTCLLTGCLLQSEPCGLDFKAVDGQCVPLQAPPPFTSDPDALSDASTDAADARDLGLRLEPIFDASIVDVEPDSAVQEDEWSAYSVVLLVDRSPDESANGTPAIPERIQALMDAGCERILLAPLYPQYSAATTATVVDKAADKLRTMRWQPSLRTLPPYHDDPAYIDALAQDLSRQLDALDFAPEVLLLSFHGMPQRTLELGDPYHCHCQKTSRLLQERLARPGLRFRTTFQSRFGPAKWLGPATDDTFAEEAQAGTKRLAVAAPGFSADCLETLEELAIQGREQFTEAGGAQFAALSCLNTSAAGLDMLETLLRRELSGWIPA